MAGELSFGDGGFDLGEVEAGRPGRLAGRAGVAHHATPPGDDLGGKRNEMSGLAGGWYPYDADSIGVASKIARISDLPGGAGKAGKGGRAGVCARCGNLSTVLRIAG